MKNFKSSALLVAIAATLVTTACSSNKAKPAAETASDTSSMKPTAVVAKNTVKLGKASSGRAR